MCEVEQVSVENLRLRLQKRIDSKTKPPGSLGILEDLALKMGLILKTDRPKISNPQILVFAADHGVTEEGTSAFPSEVTAQMVLNFLSGGAAINVFCEQNGIGLGVVNIGVKGSLESINGLVNQPVGYGTSNFCRESAMSIQQLDQAMNLGASLVSERYDQNCNVIGFGEMGIGNTTSAAALMSFYLDLEPQDCVGRGTGIDDGGLKRKEMALERARELHINKTQPKEILAAVGGFEIAGIVGAMLKAKDLGMIILVDGFIASAAALAAFMIEPSSKDNMIFCHVSAEKAHCLLLDKLDVKPILDLKLRLGEGTGVAVALPLLKSAILFLENMASFESAGVSDAL
ncbi:MAG: nicotinate-nucleotide--dimethylbenzimidazole phosphoribosyltransferase [bacterium]|nr:nicotinate-nucleotide--dimethylbenzimidazole phosphoribosyltransferase [bacterium]